MMHVFKVVGKSMEPNFYEGDYVVALRYLFSKPNAGDAVLVKYGNRTILKRIKKIRGGKYFLTGDNAKESTDSRHFGYVDGESIFAKVFLRFKSTKE